MSQTLLEMAKDLVMAQIAARHLSPDEMHQALQHTYASLQALKAQEVAKGSVAVVIPETPPAPINWRKSITKHTVTCWRAEPASSNCRSDISRNMGWMDGHIEPNMEFLVPNR
jgi:predicted transcriptional regulator